MIAKESFFSTAQTATIGAILGYGLIIFLVILLIAFLYQGRKRQRSAPFLTLAIILGIVGQGIASLIPADISVLIAVMTISVSFLCIFLHYDGLTSLRISVVPFTIILILNSMLAGVVLLAGMNQVQDIYFAYLLVRVIASMATLLAISLSLKIIYTIHIEALEKSTMLELVGISLLFLYRVVFGFRDFGEALGFFSLPIHLALTWIGLGAAMIGLYAVVINYTIHPDYIYRLPFPVHSMILYNRAGMSVYNRRVHSPAARIEHEDVLISGAFTAITQLINEILGSGAELRWIDADAYQIFFTVLEDDAGTFVVIAHGGTRYFEQSLTRFSNNIPSGIIKTINDTLIDPNLQLELDSLITQAFPYLEIQE